jgi:hypothetical protein
MLSQFRRRRREEDGIYAVLFVILLGVFVMAGALAVDIGQLYMTRHATQSVADMAATAGGLALEPTTGGTPRDGCLDAWAYAVSNLPDAPNTSPNPCAGMPASGLACTPTSTPTTVTGTIPSTGQPLYTIRITWPVADADQAMDGRLTEVIDGTQCQRIGVSIERVNDMLLASFIGRNRISVNSASVARAQTSETGGDLVALVVLDRTSCRVLTTSGQGNVYVEAALTTDDAGNDIWVPGAITVDSDGTTNCTANPRYVIAPSGNNVNSYIIAENAPAGSPGVILSYAQLVNPSRSVDPSTCGPNGSPTTGTPVQPCPVGGNRVTRAPIDHRYNCKATYPSSLDIAGCPDAASNPNGDYIDQLVAAYEGTSANPPLTGIPAVFSPGTFNVYPRPGEPTDTCQINSAVSIDLGSGNWFIDCPNTGGSGNTPGFRLSNSGASFSAGPGDIVFAGGVEVSNGAFTIGAPGSQSVMYVRPHPNATQGDGDFIKGAQGQITLEETFVYIQRGVLNVGAGSPTLRWVAPDRETYPFDDLALWSESPKSHLLGGQGNLDVEGTFFAPNAGKSGPNDAFDFNGQGSQSQARAQFITWKLNFSGQAGLRMRPDPDRSTPIPLQGVRLIR